MIQTEIADSVLAQSSADLVAQFLYLADNPPVHRQDLSPDLEASKIVIPAIDFVAREVVKVEAELRTRSIGKRLRRRIDEALVS